VFGKAALGYILALLLLVCCVPVCRAQPQPFITEYEIDRDAIEIPFEYVHHEILIHADVDDLKGLTLIFDTGASSPTFDSSLKLNGSHLANNLIHEAEGQEPGETVWLSEIKLRGPLGAVTAVNIAALVTDLAQVGKVVGKHVDGLLGISFTSGYVVEIDYERQMLVFHSPRAFTIAGRAGDSSRSFMFDTKPAAPSRRVSSVMVAGKLAGEYDYDFLVDTGFGGYVSVAQAAAQQSGLFTEDTPHVTSTSFSLSHKFTSNKIRAGFLMLGDINLSHRVVQVDVRNNDRDGQTGIVGNRLLQNYHVTLDYPRRKLLLERVTRTEEPDETEQPSIGISYRSTGQALRVERVSPYSPAAVSGVKPGDLVVSVNSHRLAELSRSELVEMLKPQSGAVTLTLTRGEAETDQGYFSVTLRATSPYDWIPSTK
jgi:predicted aspartyl protease